MDLINTQFIIKIADLGLSRYLDIDDLSSTICGSPLMMAPEVINGNDYNHKADIWSIGVIFYEMLVGSTPFIGLNKFDLKKNLEYGEFIWPKHIDISLAGFYFINNCL